MLEQRSSRKFASCAFEWRACTDWRSSMHIQIQPSIYAQYLHRGGKPELFDEQPFDHLNVVEGVNVQLARARAMELFEANAEMQVVSICPPQGVVRGEIIQRVRRQHHNPASSPCPASGSRPFNSRHPLWWGCSKRPLPVVPLALSQPGQFKSSFETTTVQYEPSAGPSDAVGMSNVWCMRCLRCSCGSSSDC